MKPEDAIDILDMLVAATTNYPLDANKRELWLSQLIPLDGELAAAAVLRGMRGWSAFPSWAQYHDAYVAERDQRARDSAITENAEERKRGARAPTWVYVWWWCRNSREPREERRFPQQGPDPEALSQTEYKSLLKEWETAGSPRPANLLVAV